MLFLALYKVEDIAKRATQPRVTLNPYCSPCSVDESCTMGNIHSGVNNYNESFALDNSSEVVLRKTKSRRGREVVDTWTAEYSIVRTPCELCFIKTSKTHEEEEEVSITIHDRSPGRANDNVEFKIDVSIVEGLLLGNITLDGPRSMQQLPPCKTPLPRGGVFKSSSFLYGRDTERKGLIVVLMAKYNDDDEELPYLITVKHFYVAPCYSQGVYAVAKVCINDSGNGGLRVQIEKPIPKSTRYLESVFDNVKGNGWKIDPNSSDFAIENPNKGTVPVAYHGGNNSNHANGDPYSYSMSGHQQISSLVSSSGYTNGNLNNSLILHGCKVLFDANGKFRFY